MSHHVRPHKRLGIQSNVFLRLSQMFSRCYVGFIHLDADQMCVARGYVSSHFSGAVKICFDPGDVEIGLAPLFGDDDLSSSFLFLQVPYMIPRGVNRGCGL